MSYRNERVRRLPGVGPGSEAQGKVTEPAAMAEAILGVSMKALGLEKALLLARNETGGSEIRTVVGLGPEAAGQLSRVCPAKPAQGFAPPPHAHRANAGKLSGPTPPGV